MTTTDLLKRRLPVMLGIIALMVILDQWTKAWAIDTRMGQPDIEYMDGLFRLTYVQNRGAFLSLGNNLGDGMRMVLLNILPAILLVGMFFYILFSRSLDRVQVIGLSAIVGGGLSNIVDRIISGYVVDFMHMKAFGLQTGIFNVADLAIVFGMIFILPSMIRGERRDKQEVQERVVDQTGAVNGETDEQLKA